MDDPLIRDVPDEVVTAVDAKGTEVATGQPMTAQDLFWFGDRFSDLANPDVMRRAWL